MTGRPSPVILRIATDEGTGQMPETPVIPLVTFRVQLEGQLSTHTGHLIQQANGQIWIFPESVDVTKPPHLAGAYEVVASDLQQLPDTPDGIPTYLCRKVFGALH